MNRTFFSRVCEPLLLATLLALSACDRGRVSSQPPSLSGPDSPAQSVGQHRSALGEVVSGFPSDQERMVLVLTNMSRHSARPGFGCGDWTQERGANVKLSPLVYSQVGTKAARFTSVHMADQGCFQHESCCVLSATDGEIGCSAEASCEGAACGQTCTGGTPTQKRYELLQFKSWSGENIAAGQPNAYEAWCAWMNSDGHRANIYADHTELGVGAHRGAGSCTGWYWTQAFGRGAVSVPRIPAATGLYSPDNPASSAALKFLANYYDPTPGALSPKRAAVVVDGQCLDLERGWGYDDNGTYFTSFAEPGELLAGCHRYYFLFVDGAGARHVYPDSGSLALAVGQGQSCPSPYEPGPQAVANCETGEQQCQPGTSQGCWQGGAATRAKGECKDGYQVCRNGLWSSCRGELRPKLEICDGLDNDCDGLTDEDNSGGGASCLVDAERGECRAGTRQCVAGGLSCVPQKSPSAEVCDGLDNDCDGVVDDGFGQKRCGVGDCLRVVAACEKGTPLDCVEGSPSAEVADNSDNDCDGQVDEDIDCRLPDGSGVGRLVQCYASQGTFSDGGVINLLSPCAKGYQRCEAQGQWGACVGQVLPSAEVCDGIDNDCNGRVDDSETLGWERCGKGVCINFAQSCKGGKPQSCQALPAVEERCDGQDNDCDGTVDEACSCRETDHPACYSGPPSSRGKGQCKSGTRACVNGTFGACEGEVLPAAEACNGTDDDCDGLPDPEVADGGVADQCGTGEDGGLEAEPLPAPAGCGCSGAEGLWVFAAGLGVGRVGRRRRRLAVAC